MRIGKVRRRSPNADSPEYVWPLAAGASPDPPPSRPGSTGWGKRPRPVRFAAARLLAGPLRCLLSMAVSAAEVHFVGAEDFSRSRLSKAGRALTRPPRVCGDCALRRSHTGESY